MVGLFSSSLLPLPLSDFVVSFSLLFSFLLFSSSFLVSFLSYTPYTVRLSGGVLATANAYTTNPSPEPLHPNSAHCSQRSPPPPPPPSLNLSVSTSYIFFFFLFSSSSLLSPVFCLPPSGIPSDRTAAPIHYSTRR